MKIYKLENPYLGFEYSFDSLKKAQEMVTIIFEETNLICEIKVL